MRNGLVVAVPNPSPMLGGGDIDAAIRVALEEAEAKGLSGRDITPFVLATVNETTGGQSLKSNVALVSVRRVRIEPVSILCYQTDLCGPDAPCHEQLKMYLHYMCREQVPFERLC